MWFVVVWISLASLWFDVKVTPEEAGGTPKAQITHARKNIDVDVITQAWGD